MDKQLTWKITEETLASLPKKTVGSVLKHCLKLTPREISRAKFTAEGILLKTASGVTLPARVTSPAVPGATILVRLKETAPSRLLPVTGALDILHEDEDLIVLNKPAGIPCHPSKGHYSDSLSNRLASYLAGREDGTLPENDTSEPSQCVKIENDAPEPSQCVKIKNDAPEPSRCVKTAVPHLVGRLDRDASGILLFAKNKPAAARLSALRAAGGLRKTYLAIAECRNGAPPETVTGEHVVTLPIAKVTVNDRDRYFVCDGDAPGDARLSPAVTHYRVLARLGSRALLALEIETGRTHQIRLHMAYLGMPLLGDALYGRALPGCRTMLHAYRLQLQTPFTGERLCLTAPLPEEFLQAAGSLTSGILKQRDGSDASF